MGLRIYIDQTYLVSCVPRHEAGLLSYLFRTSRVVAQESFWDPEMNFAWYNIPHYPGLLNWINIKILSQIWWEETVELENVAVTDAYRQSWHTSFKSCVFLYKRTILLCHLVKVSLVIDYFKESIVVVRQEYLLVLSMELRECELCFYLNAVINWNAYRNESMESLVEGLEAI